MNSEEILDSGLPRVLGRRGAARLPLSWMRKRGRPSPKSFGPLRHGSQPALTPPPPLLNACHWMVARSLRLESGSLLDKSPRHPPLTSSDWLAARWRNGRGGSRRAPALQRAARRRRGGAGGLARAAAVAVADGSGPVWRAYGAPGQGCGHLGRGRRVCGLRSAEAGAAKAPSE